MYVYRVEHRECGIGPYNAHFQDSSKECMDARCKLVDVLDYNKHPVVSDLLGWTYSHYSGFKSFDQLKDWFEGCLETLDKCNFVVRTYTVKKKYVIGDDKQVAFVKDRAKLIKTRTFKDKVFA